MKKKILFLILLLIPFIVQAKSNFELVKIWDSEQERTYDNTYITDDKFIKYSSYQYYGDTSQFLSVDILTGEKTAIEIPAQNARDGCFLYAFYDDHFVIITKDDNSTFKVTVYDRTLKPTHEETIGTFEIDYWNADEEEIVLSGNTVDNNEYTRHIYFINTNGEVINSDHIKTINRTNQYTNRSGEVFFMDNYNAEYHIVNHKLAPYYTVGNDYIVSLSDKIIKLNSEGNQIAEVAIPQGDLTRIAKKDNTFYLISAIYTQRNGFYYFRTVLYTMTEDMVLSSPTTPYPENTISTLGLGRNNYNVLNINGTMYMLIMRTGVYTYYELHEDLTFEETTYQNQFYNSKSSYGTHLYSTDNSFNYEDYYRGDDYYDAIYRMYDILEIDDYGASQINVDIDKKGNKAAIITYKKAITEDGEEIPSVPTYGTVDVYAKADLIYFDKDYNIIFQKNIYDWTKIGTSNCGTSLVLSDVKFFDDYILVALNNNQENMFKVYDKQGNEVYDKSEDVNNYKHLAFKKMKVYERSIYLEYQETLTGCAGGVSEYVNSNPNVLPANTYTTKNYMVFYELPFLVDTKVNGGGTVTAKQIRALTGSSVEFTVTPDPGYVLSVVKVTDANGNVLTFTNNTFVMPSADVIIEATFVPINPNTGNVAIISIIILAIASFAMVIYEKRKVNALK